MSRAHVADAHGLCTACGTILTPLTEGTLVGTDCDGTPERERLYDLQRLLAEATGVILDLHTLAAWTPAQLDEAHVWACAQIHATTEAKPGTSVSVQWPAHVSEARAAVIMAFRAARAPGRAQKRSSRGGQGTGAPASRSRATSQPRQPKAARKTRA